MLANEQIIDKQSYANGAIAPANTDVPPLTKKEREVLVEYDDDFHLSLRQHDHDNVEVAKSDGEKLFDRIAYKGMAWWGGACLGIFMSYKFKQTGAKFEKVVDILAPYYQKLMNVEEEIARRATSSGLIHSGLILGGSIPVYPVKKLEDNKLEWVQYLDTALNDWNRKKGYAPTEEQLAVQKAAHERIAHEPRQTWPSVITGRVLGAGSVFTTAIFLTKGKDKEILETAMKSMTKSEPLQTFGTIAALEFGYTFVTEEILYYTTRLYKALKEGGGTRLPIKKLSLPVEPTPEINTVDTLSHNQPQEIEHMGVSA